MPIVKISIMNGKSPEYKKAIMEQVHGALAESFRIPDSDRTQRLEEYDPAYFEVNAGRTGNYTLIELSVFTGRSHDAKKDLYSGIVRRLSENPGIDGNDITILLYEIPSENWGIRGGKMASEIDLGFSLKV